MDGRERSREAESEDTGRGGFCVAAGLKSEQQNKEEREGADGDTPTELSYVNTPKSLKVNGSLVSHTS